MLIFKQIVSIVGTRKATEHGKRLCTKFIEDLAEFDKNIVIVGIDEGGEILKKIAPELDILELNEKVKITEKLIHEKEYDIIVSTCIKIQDSKASPPLSITILPVFSSFIGLIII